MNIYFVSPILRNKVTTAGIIMPAHMRLGVKAFEFDEKGMRQYYRFAKMMLFPNILQNHVLSSFNGLGMYVTP